MDAKNYLWYPYLRYQQKCKEEGREDTIQEFLILNGTIPPPPKPKRKRKASTAKAIRARNKNGQFVANNPNTKFNEAWFGGKPPPKKTK